MKVSGVGFNLVAQSPFVIGNVPFRGVSTHPPTSYQPTAPECLINDPPPPYTEKPLEIPKSNTSDDDFELLDM